MTTVAEAHWITWVTAGAAVFSILAVFFSAAIAWGAISAQFKTVKETVKAINEIIYPDPAQSSQKLLTAKDCSKCRSGLYKCITDLEESFESKMDGTENNFYLALQETEKQFHHRLDEIEKRRSESAQKYDQRWKSIQVYMKSIAGSLGNMKLKENQSATNNH